jgi:hypothetical protein
MQFLKLCLLISSFFLMFKIPCKLSSHILIHEVVLTPNMKKIMNWMFGMCVINWWFFCSYFHCVISWYQNFIKMKFFWGLPKNNVKKLHFFVMFISYKSKWFIILIRWQVVQMFSSWIICSIERKFYIKLHVVTFSQKFQIYLGFYSTPICLFGISKSINMILLKNWNVKQVFPYTLCWNFWLYLFDGILMRPFKASS